MLSQGIKSSVFSIVFHRLGERADGLIAGAIIKLLQTLDRISRGFRAAQRMKDLRFSSISGECIGRHEDRYDKKQNNWRGAEAHERSPLSQHGDESARFAFAIKQ